MQCRNKAKINSHCCIGLKQGYILTDVQDESRDTFSLLFRTKAEIQPHYCRRLKQRYNIFLVQNKSRYTVSLLYRNPNTHKFFITITFIVNFYLILN